MTMSETKMTLYKEVVEKEKKRITKAILDLWAIWDSLAMEGSLCDEVSCIDCPACETCSFYRSGAIVHIETAIVKFVRLKRGFDHIITELSNEEQAIDQEVQC